MSDKSNYINGLMKDRMILNLYTYNYSSPVTLVKDSLITLFSDENWRLSHNVNRFKIENIDMSLESDIISISDFEYSINELHDSYNIPTFRFPGLNPDLVLQFINNPAHSAGNGSDVYNFTQDSTECYEVLNDNLLITALQKAKTNHYQQLVPVKEDDDKFLVDLEYNKVMKQMYHRMACFRELYYVIPPFNNKNFNIVTPNSLSAVLYALDLGINAENIKKLILYPTLTPDELANVKLIYSKDIHTKLFEVYEITAIEDIGYYAPDDDDSNPATYDCYFYNPDSEELTTLIAHDDIDSALTYIYHKEYDPELNADQHKLTNALIDIADKHNLSIQRQLRRKSTISQINHIDFENKKLTSYDSELVQDYGNNCWIESVFNVIEKDTKNQVMYDMTIGQLFSYIVSLDYPSLEE